MQFYNTDINVAMQFTIYEYVDNIKTIRNISNATIVLLVAGTGVERGCDIIDGPNGRCNYNTVEDDFIAGSYTAQLRITIPTEGTFNTNNFVFTVLQSVQI